MAVKRTPVQPVRVDYGCDRCGARMVYDPPHELTDPHCRVFPHKCQNCGATAILDSVFPFIEYEERGISV